MLCRAIEQGEKPLSEFVSRQEAFVRAQVAKAAEGSVTIASAQPTRSTVTGVTHKKSAVSLTEHRCGACGSALVRRPSKQPKGGFWFGCSNYPTCKQTYPDLKGQPDYGKGRATISAPVPA